MESQAITPHPLNAPGDFYVEYGCCTACDVPISAAPELFEYDDSLHCFVKVQPRNADELNQVIDAIRCAELRCIRYRGTDRDLLSQLVEIGEGPVCDNLPTDLMARSEEILAAQHRVEASPWQLLWEGITRWLRLR